MNTRRESRETAFALLFEWSFKQNESLDDIIDNATYYREIKVDDFSFELANNAIVNITEIDDNIGKYLKDWKLDRLSKVSLACLRLAFSEIMFFKDIPAAVTANEIVEIAKEYGTEKEAAFIHGMVGSLTYEKE